MLMLKNTETIGYLLNIVYFDKKKISLKGVAEQTSVFASEMLPCVTTQLMDSNDFRRETVFSPTSMRTIH